MTTSRLRSRLVHGYWEYWQNSLRISTTNTSLNEHIRDMRVGPCSCSHIRPGRIDWCGRVSHDYWDWVFNYPVIPPNLLEVQNWANTQALSLNWSKLPSSSEFGLIQIFAEIDDTIALFTKRFWSAISYGSFTWGVLPFVQDLVACAQAVQNIAKDISNFSYEDSMKVSKSFDFKQSFMANRSHWLRNVAEIKTHVAGQADISFQHDLSLTLDWLGFHPDLATAWDLVPLSFLVDYLVPIGDYLESFRQGGWVKAALFDGWITYKLTVRIEREIRSGPLTGNRHVLTSVPYREYNRARSGAVLTIPSITSPEFSAPSFREMFNILYVFASRRRR